MIVEMNEVLNIVDTEVTSVEKNISNTASRLIIYRISSKYKENLNVQIRGTFDSFYDRLMSGTYISKVLSSTSLDIGLKQMMCDFGVYFTEDTFGGIDDKRSGTRRLGILDEWVGVEEFNNMRKCEDGFIITDLFICSLHDNSYYYDIRNAFNNSRYNPPELWYEVDEYNLYSKRDERDSAYSAKFSEDEMLDITKDLYRIMNTRDMKSTVFMELIEFGEKIYNDGIQCVKFSHTGIDIKYSGVYAAYLIYLAEEYGMSINTEMDGIFCKLYSEYKYGNYCLAEDLFTLVNSISPVMYFVNNATKRMIFVRDLVCSYSYFYVTKDELELMILNDSSIKMKEWNSMSRSVYKETGFVKKNETESSEFVGKFLNGGIFEDLDIVPVFEVLDTEDKIKDTVNAFNKYNLRKSGGVVWKYITVRDLLCQRVLDGDKEEIRVGYLYSPSKDDYNFRAKLTATVSEVHDVSNNDIKPISRNYMTFNSRYISRLFDIGYVFNLYKEAKSAVLNLIRDTCDIDDSDEDTDDEEVYDDSYCSMAEKFLYYKITEMFRRNGKRENIVETPSNKVELKASMFGAVYTSAEVVPELAHRFGISNIIEAEVIDIYGNITDKFIDTKNDNPMFILRNELFGIMK